MSKAKTKTPYIPATELKTILHSKRANLYYLEHCRVLVNGGRVEYVTDQGKESLYWNIPIANTTCILLGSGTSITQAAVRDLAKAQGLEPDIAERTWRSMISAYIDFEHREFKTLRKLD